MPLQDEIASALGGDDRPLKSRGEGKSKKRSPEEVVASLSPRQRSALRARVEAILEALDAVEAESESEPDEEEEM
jgi:hypothetical protein